MRNEILKVNAANEAGLYIDFVASTTGGGLCRHKWGQKLLHWIIDIWY